MDDMYSALSAMLDNEPCDPAVLAAALETREGRDLLIDLVALRRLVQTQATMSEPAIRPAPRPAWRLMAAAAVILAAVGGYAIGERRAESAAPVVSAAPAPTRVVETTATWQPVQAGGLP